MCVLPFWFVFYFFLVSLYTTLQQSFDLLNFCCRICETVGWVFEVLYWQLDFLSAESVRRLAGHSRCCIDSWTCCLQNLWDSWLGIQCVVLTAGLVVCRGGVPAVGQDGPRLVSCQWRQGQHRSVRQSRSQEGRWALWSEETGSPLWAREHWWVWGEWLQVMIIL